MKLFHRRAVDAQPFGDGLRNANFKLQFDQPTEFAVLRIYEHDRSLCRKELDLLNFVRGDIPVPEAIHAEPDGWHEIPPFAVLLYVEGITFRDLKCGGDRGAIAQAAYSIGQTLVQIGRTTFPKPGWIGPGPSVASPLLEGADPGPRFVDLCLASANLQRRMEPELRDRTHAVVWQYAPCLASLDSESRLVHGDFGKRNILVRQIAGKWCVAAILDWEFAISGSPLADVGHFLRYERSARPLVEPSFSAGFSQAGGTLPPDWRRLARMVDLIALCSALTVDELPAGAEAELVELVELICRQP